jgi:Fur family transcriptional regulator, ferric uptake regulator
MDSSQLGQRQTRQRDAIYQVIEAATGPLSVPEIHDRARVLFPRLGIATVYRTVKLLQEGGRIQSVILPSGETRYEETGLGHHEHFQCRKCSQVFDIKVCPVHIPKGTELTGGFVVDDHELTIYGTCPDCVAEPKKTKKR